jgi:ribose transport system substrate-binding protein
MPSAKKQGGFCQMTALSRRHFLSAAGAGGATLVVAPSALGLAGGETPSRQVIIGVSTQDLQNQYWLQLIEAFKRAAEPIGAKILVGSAMSMDPAAQAQDVSNFLTQGAQAFAVSPVNPAALQPIFDRARQQGVYVVNNHFPVAFGHYDIFLDTGPYESGQLAGTHAAKLINQKFGGQGRIALLTLPENETLTIRVHGIIDSVKQNSAQSQIISQQRATDQSNAESVVGNILTAHPDINTILGWSDTVVLGGVAAISNIQKNPSDFVIVGIDATRDALDAVQSGKMSATVNNPPDKFGKLAFDVCYGLVTDPKSDWHFVQHAITQLQLVTPKNVQEFIGK